MQIQESDLFNLLSGWPIEPPFMLASLAGGTNNRAWLVETRDGPSYVLRLTAGMADLPRIRYEAALLSALHATPLPFLLPLPLLAYTGEMLVLVEMGHAGATIATLSPLLPGHVPERNAANIAHVGAALAQLDAALASIPPTALPINPSSTRFLYGDLFHCHPLVPDPLAAVEQILQPAQAQAIAPILKQTQRDWEMLSTQDLPQQVLHRDCGPGNVLMEGERVTAILDFEFAGIDRRVFDLCVAISWWPVRLMGTGQEWELIDSFGRAYTAYVPLVDEELLALPAALRMRDTTSLIYRIGRYIAGQESAKTIQERARHSLWREKWLAGNREILVQHALTWAKSHHK
ncbi:MAG TPA: phosphotransferase [Ktedonobacteraceae bacterium]